MFQRMFRPSSELRGHHRRRLLIESPDPVLPVAEFRLFEDSGLDVALCSGPCDGDGCSLVAGDGCALVDSADVVLMGPGMARHRLEIAAAIRRHRPDMPVVVQVPRSGPGQCPPGCRAAYFPASVDGQIRSVWRALEGRTSSGSPPPAP